MPELPEVETVRSGLNNLIIGKTIISVSSDRVKSLQAHQEDINN